MKSYKFRFGYYNLNPKDANETEVILPDDTIFITGGLNDIGKFKHENAYHILAFTKCSKKEINEVNEKQGLNYEVLSIKTRVDDYFEYLTINGYYVIKLNNCIPSNIEFTSADDLNKLLDLKINPVYVIQITDEYNIIDIVRIDRIESYYNTYNTRIVAFNSLLKTPSYLIEPLRVDELSSIISCYRKFSVAVPNPIYGQKLFTEMMYKTLSYVYPEFNKKLIGYDLSYMNMVYKDLFDNFDLYNSNYDDMFRIQEELNKLKEYATFKKELPIIK